jgi:hypothetical protein
VEGVIAVGILGTAMALAVQGLATGSRGMGTVRDLTTAQNIARSQLEYTMSGAYCAAPCSYPTVTVPDTYTVTSEAETFLGADTNLGYVVVTVSKGGVPLVQVRTIKVNR